MEHIPDRGQFRQQSETDFVIPLKQVGLITRAVLEGVYARYSPRRIIVVTSRREIRILMKLAPTWSVNRLEYVAEEDFFLPNFNLTMSDILSEYDMSRGPQQREPGWWIQQLIKLGAGTQIPCLSNVYAGNLFY